MAGWLLESARFYAAPITDPSGRILERYAIIVRAAMAKQLQITDGARGLLLDMAVESFRQWIWWCHRATSLADGMGPTPITKCVAGPRPVRAGGRS